VVRPTRTTAQIKEEILKHVAFYTCARTDWEGERREAKKKALRTAARLMRQLCERGGHKIGWTVDGQPDAVIGEFKCPVCDPSGDAKREANIGTEAMEERRKATTEAYDVATGKKEPPTRVRTGECRQCHSRMDPKYIKESGVCDMCVDTNGIGGL
jgi:hypothetical protein